MNHTQIMNNRLKLHSMLCSMLGSNNVYFQPPASVKMNYPAIVYSRNYVTDYIADNKKYLSATEYSVTIIDKNPDSKIVEKFVNTERFHFSRHYISDNLNHDVFTIKI